MHITPFDPATVYAAPRGSNRRTPGVFIAPARYIQGQGVLEDIGRYLSLVPARRFGVLASARGQQADAARMIASIETAGLEAVPGIFHGEVTRAEMADHERAFRDAAVECVIACGGGKCIDAGKGIAWRLGVPTVVVPTLASNDAPCSALSVLYTEQGVTEGTEFYPHSPVLVVVDTAIVAAARERYLVAGMGDALATWYEAKVCLHNPAATTPLGARPTLASCALGEVCARTLYAEGVAASQAVAAGRVDEPLEHVVEANTLLSGIGFESGGIAGAHSIAQSYTVIPRVHAGYLHGEMVAMGLLAQLMMSGEVDEARRAATLCAQVGLPVHLGQLSMDPGDVADLAAIAEFAVGFPLMHNMPFQVTTDVVLQGIGAAHTLGLEVATAVGDQAYRRLQAGA